MASRGRCITNMRSQQWTLQMEDLHTLSSLPVSTTSTPELLLSSSHLLFLQKF